MGLGISPGQIHADEPLNPGGRYRLPSLTVLNTGDVAGEFEIVVGYLAGQAERRPPESWFEFRPQRFSLAPGESQEVALALALPTRVEPGAYFALLEAHPVVAGQGVAVSVAVATKLSFTVRPATVLQAWLVRADHLLSDSQPWASLVFVALLAFFGVRLVGRYVRIGVRIERRR